MGKTKKTTKRLFLRASQAFGTQQTGQKDETIKFFEEAIAYKAGGDFDGLYQELQRRRAPAFHAEEIKLVQEIAKRMGEQSSRQIFILHSLYIFSI